MRNFKELLLCTLAFALLVTLCGAAAGGSKAQELRCRASLQAVYRMANSYSADNDAHIVRMLERRYNRGTFWSDKLQVYAKDFKDFSCPLNTKRGAQAYVQDDLLPGRYATNYVSYGINGHISGVHRKNAPFEKINFMKTPSYTIYFGDAQRMFLRSVGRLWAMDFIKLHNNGIQAVMADGHTEYFNQKNLGTFGRQPGWKQDKKRWKNWKNGK